MNNSKHIQLHGLTDVGCTRTENEDCFMIQLVGDPRGSLNPTQVFDVQEDRDVFMAVSDGMGGAAAGEVASRTALTTLGEVLADREQLLRNASPEEIVKILEKGLQEANGAIIRKAQEIQSRRGMGATVTALYLKGDVMYLFQIGDSRAYVLRDGRLNRITRDQSFVGHLVEMGTITESQAMRHPQRNVILQALGTQEELKVDVSFLPLCKGDLVIVCSDGLYTEFPPETLTRKVQDLADKDFTVILQTLVQEAKQAGGKDNITVIGLAVKDGMPRREPGEEPRYRPFPFLDQDDPLRKAQSIFQ